MAPPDSQVAHLLDLLESLGGVTARSMFGEHGFFREGSMLGLIYQKVFYLRVDDQTRPLHEARGLAPFVYQSKGGKRMVMPYYEVPPEALDNHEEMRHWAEPAARAAAQAAAAKKKPARRAAPKAAPKQAAKPVSKPAKPAVKRPAPKAAARTARPKKRSR